jgi:hypothetical protein
MVKWAKGKGWDYLVRLRDGGFASWRYEMKRVWLGVEGSICGFADFAGGSTTSQGGFDICVIFTTPVV